LEEVAEREARGAFFSRRRGAPVTFVSQQIRGSAPRAGHATSI